MIGILLKPVVSITGAVNLAKELHGKYIQVNPMHATHMIQAVAELLSSEVGGEALAECQRDYVGFLEHFHYTVALLVDSRDVGNYLNVLSCPTMTVTVSRDTLIIATGSLATWRYICSKDPSHSSELIEQLETLFTDAGLGKFINGG